MFTKKCAIASVHKLKPTFNNILSCTTGNMKSRLETFKKQINKRTKSSRVLSVS